MVLFYGAYERHALAFLAQAASVQRGRRGSVSYFDVGANVGHHSLFMSAIADSVLAFEPYPPLQAKIAEKIGINNINNIQIVPFALGDETTELGYHPGAGTNSGAGTFLNDTAGAKADAEKLSIRMGDELLGELNAPRIDVLKIDVEGFEVPVLRGLQQRILRDRPIILTELGDRTKRAVQTLSEYRSLFYPDARLFLLSGRSNLSRYRLVPFDFTLRKECLVAALPPEVSSAMEQQE
jgi:FkbM family methyltransferase